MKVLINGDTYMIPKVIHYCWFGRNKLPNDVKECIKSWKKMCPVYEIKCWNEDNFNVYENKFLKSAYNAGAWAFVSDYARLKVVYEHGGIYLDTDVELIKPLDEILKYKYYIGVQQVGKYCTTGLGFGAEKYNKIIEAMLEEYDDVIYSEENSMNIACPILNNKIFEKMGYTHCDYPVELEGGVIFPPRYLDPIAPGEAENLFCEDTISVHHYSASWMSSKVQFRRKIIRKIGDKNVMKLKKFLKKNNN